MHFTQSFETWWRKDPILKIGNHTYTRETAVRQLGCSSFRAAQNLQRAVDELGVSNLRQLSKISPRELMKVAGVGERAVFVAMCALDANEYDGRQWLEFDGEAATAARKSA